MIPGLHFPDASAAHGPLMHFVSGSRYAATSLVRAMAPQHVAFPLRMQWLSPAPEVELAG